MWLSILDSVVQNVLFFVKSKVKICTFFERNFNKIYRGKRVLNRWAFMLRDICSFNLFQVNNLGYYARTVQLTTLSLIETIRVLPQYASLCKI